MPALEDAGGDVRYSVYEGVGHDFGVIERTLGNPEVIEWLLSQRRSAR